MAIVTKGTENRAGDRSVEAGCQTHREACAAAAEIGKASTAGRKSTTLQPTVGVHLLYSFDDAQTYVETPDTDSGVAAAIRQAVADGASDDELAALQRKTASTLVNQQARFVLARQMDDVAIGNDGTRYPAGSWLVKPESGKPFMVSDEDFQGRFRKPKKAEVEKHEERVAELEEDSMVADDSEDEGFSFSSPPKSFASDSDVDETTTDEGSDD